MTELEADLDRLIDRDQDAIGCPYPLFSELRDKSPVHYSEKLGAWVCTRYDDILEVLHDTDQFSSSMPTGPSKLPAILAAGMEQLKNDPSMAETFSKVMKQRGAAAVLLNADPPEHRRQRKAVNGAFRPSRMRAMEPTIEKVTDELLDAAVADGQMEVVGDFAVGLPMTIIAYALGVGDEDLATFKKWSDDLVMPVGNPTPTTGQVRDYLVSNSEFADFFSQLLAERREHPTDDIISDVANAEFDGQALSDPEALSMLSQFLVAGNETTTKLLTNLVHHLAIDDGLEARLRSDRGLIEGFIEEALRFEAPVGGLFRQAKVDVEVGGQHVAAGDHVWVLFAAGNRDAAVLAEPDDFDPARENIRDHIAFGHGEHFCIGAQLARSEAKIAVNKLLDRVQNIRLTDDGETLAYEDTFVLRGLKELYVEFDPVPI
ncbi:MAG: cytochrome P450 [Acidimicrobiales bacterium]